VTHIRCFAAMWLIQSRRVIRMFDQLIAFSDDVLHLTA
jgi:hypothetical protein